MGVRLLEKRGASPVKLGNLGRTRSLKVVKSKTEKARVEFGKYGGDGAVLEGVKDELEMQEMQELSVRVTAHIARVY